METKTHNLLIEREKTESETASGGNYKKSLFIKIYKGQEMAESHDPLPLKEHDSRRRK